MDEPTLAEWGIRYHFDYQLENTPENETMRFTLHRLLQELPNNVCRRADASDASVTLRQREHCSFLDITDNSVGILPEEIPSFGIQGMRKRASAPGGELMLGSDNGTRITVNLPTNLQ